MSPDAVERFEAVAGELIEELGYDRAFPRPRAELQARAADFLERAAAELRTRRRPVPSAW
jgi:hypothetical protein